MVISATFIGQNGSLGYLTNKPYQLNITKSVSKKGNIKITRNVSPPDPFGNCVYSNIETFLQNWTNIKTVK